MHPKTRRRSFLKRLGAMTTVGALATITGGCGEPGGGEAAKEAEERAPIAHFRPDSGATDADTGIEADPVGQGQGEAREE